MAVAPGLAPAPVAATESNGRGRGAEAAIRPERFARLVTLASVLIAAGRAGERLQVKAVCEQLKMSAAGAARGRLGAQRRQNAPTWAGCFLEPGRGTETRPETELSNINGGYHPRSEP